MKDTIEQAIDTINESDALLITAGAGMGVDSGLPDFRGKEGFWRAYPPLKDLEITFEDIANPEWFEMDPYLIWGFYGHRLNLYREIGPHSGYKQLLDIAKAKDDYFVFTSNVDGQFQKAGYDSERIVECHGSIHHLQCSTNCTNTIWSTNKIEISVNEVAMEAIGELPMCPNCRKVSRPNILMFDDYAWNRERMNGQYQRFEEWIHHTKQKNKQVVVIEIGAGRSIPTVRRESERLAELFSGNMIRINPSIDDVGGCDVSVMMDSEKGIADIYQVLE